MSKRAGTIDELAMDFLAAGLSPVREFQFNPERKWRADFAFPEHKLLIEVEGGSWSGGRHTSGAGYARDCAKYNSAVLLGYRVLRFTADMVRDGALQTVEEALR